MIVIDIKMIWLVFFPLLALASQPLDSITAANKAWTTAYNQGGLFPFVSILRF